MLKGFILCINNNNNNKKRPVTDIQILWYVIDSNERNNKGENCPLGIRKTTIVDLTMHGRCHR